MKVAEQRAPAIRTVSPERLVGMLVGLAVVLMEAFWVFPWLLWAGRWPALDWQRTPLSLISVLALVGVSFLLARFLSGRDWTPRRITTTVAGIGLLVVFIAVREEYSAGMGLLDARWFAYIGREIAASLGHTSVFISALLIAAYVWWRGLLLGRASSTGYVHANLMYGAGSYILLALLWMGTLGDANLRESAVMFGANVAGFFFCGVMAVALNNLRVVQKRMFPEEQQTLSFRRWLPVVLAVAGAVLLVGLLIAAVSSADVVSLAKRLLSPVGVAFDTVEPWVVKIIGYILLPFEYIAMGILWLITFIVNLFQGRGVTGAGQAASEAVDKTPETPPVGSSPDALIAVLKWAAFAIGVIAVTLFVGRTVSGNKKRRRPAPGAPDYEEKRESLWSWQGFLVGIGRFFIRLWWRILRRKSPVPESPLLSHAAPRAAEPVTTLHIREVFRRLLREAGRAGIPWHHHETPFEFAGRLAEAVPAVSGQVRDLAALYVQVRYSESDAGAAQAGRANHMWREIRESIRQMKR